jgi:hypothetical protein
MPLEAAVWMAAAVALGVAAVAVVWMAGADCQNSQARPQRA